MENHIFNKLFLTNKSKLINLPIHQLNYAKFKDLFNHNIFLKGLSNLKDTA